MITPRDVKLHAMTEQKRKSDQADPFIYYILRPLSRFVTAPLLSLNVTATQVTIASLVPALLFIPVIAFAHSVSMRIVGGVIWWIWAILDCVDGDIARYRHSVSNRGELWDAAVGYVAACGWPFAIGMAAYYDNGNALLPLPIDAVCYVFMGGLSAIFVLYPRLLMHKAYRSGDRDSTAEFTSKAGYGLAKRIVLILTDSTGLPIYAYILACVFHVLNVFLMGYFLIFLVICMVSCRRVFQAMVM